MGKSLIKITVIIIAGIFFTYGCNTITRDVKEKEITPGKKNFKLEISLEKNEFVEGEKIVVRVDIKNLSPYRDSLYKILGIESLRYLLIGSEDRNAKYYGFVGEVEYLKEPYTIFEQNETITQYIRIDNLIYYKNDDLEFGYYKYTRAGKYNVSYYLPLRGNNRGDNFYINSNSIDFIVKELPENEKDILELMKEFGPLKEKGIDRIKLFIERADSIVYNSELTPVVESLASNALMYKSIIGYKVDEDLLSLVKLFFEKKPDSFTTFEFFKFYTMRKKNRNIDYKKDEEYFLNKYPESKAIMYYKNNEIIERKF